MNRPSSSATLRALMDVSPAGEAPPPQAPTPEPPPGPAGPEGSRPDGLQPGEVRWLRVGLTCLAILIVAGGAARGLVAMRSEAPRADPVQRRTGVRVIEVHTGEILPEVSALGRARALWEVPISAQVAGKALEVHEELRDGAVLTEGQIAVALDGADHRLSEERFAAQLTGLEAQQAQLQVERSTLRERIGVVERRLALEEEELARKQDLLRQGIGMQRDLDLLRTSALQIEDTLVSLRSSLALIEPRLDALAAQTRQAQADLAQARLNLERIEIRVPFTGQVSRVAVLPHQLVSAGARLFDLHRIDQIEVPVVLTLEQAALLGLSQAPGQGAAQAYETAEVSVTHEGHGDDQAWVGVLKRFEPVDAMTQTIKAVILVHNRIDQAPLLPGVFCRVSLRVPPIHVPNAIPLRVLQERDRVYVVRDGLLAVVSLQLGRRLGQWVEVQGGLEPGDQLISSPLERPVEGLALEVLGVETVSLPGSAGAEASPADPDGGSSAQ
jgi:multidrug efflux pump subunit AcrA (membrane-fusion protein)